MLNQNVAQYGQLSAGAARSDYAINSGTYGCQYDYGPGTLAQGLDPTYPWPDMSDTDGVCFMRSMVKLKEIINGTSHTYLVGEKYVNPDNYFNGMAWDDNSCLYTGYEDDNYRSSYNLDPNIPTNPYRDRPGVSPGCAFGSAHSNTWNCSYCDGSVRTVKYDLDPTIHNCQANRHNRDPFEVPH
jgi:hypothetical protein